MGYNWHDLGDLVRVTGTFTNPVGGGAIDPSVVKLSVEVLDDEGVTITPVVTYTYGVGAVIVKDSTGLYHADLDANVAGTWWYRWWSTGTGQAAEENRFKVREAKAV